MLTADLLSDSAARELLDALRRKDERMREHTERVAGVAAAIAGAMKLTADSARSIALGGLLHEVGKLEVPDAVLFKPGKLNADEMRLMRTYPFLGYERVCGLPSLASAAEIVYAHREKFDGTGYPRGLKGDEIPLAARIVAVACAFAAFVADRPHDFARAVNYARLEISAGSGSAFDPAVVEGLLGLPDEVLIPAGMKTAAP